MLRKRFSDIDDFKCSSDFTLWFPMFNKTVVSRYQYKQNKTKKKNIKLDNDDDEIDVEIDLNAIKKPSQLTLIVDFKRVSIPPHRMTPLSNNLEKIVTTIVQNLK